MADYYWKKIPFRNKETGELDGKYKFEILNYKRNYQGDRLSRIKLYADGEIIFEGGYKELTEIIKEYNSTHNNS